MGQRPGPFMTPFARVGSRLKRGLHGRGDLGWSDETVDFGFNLG